MGDGTTISINGSDPIPFETFQERVDQMLGRTPTMDEEILLNLYDIEFFGQAWNRAVEEVYGEIAKGDDGPHTVNVSLKIGKDKFGNWQAVPTIQVKGPTPAKLLAGKADLIREDGTLKIVSANQQALGLGK